MTPRRTIILTGLVVTTLTGACWLATGGSALAQEESGDRDERRGRRERRDERRDQEHRDGRDDRKDLGSDGRATTTPTTTAAGIAAPADDAPQSRPTTRPADGSRETGRPAVDSGGPTTGRAARDGRRSDAQPAMTATARADFVARYAVVYEKNIFLRDRPTYYPSGREPRGPIDASYSAAPRRPEESYVVTGIALQEGRHVAFIENTNTRETERVLDGESVANGRVVAIDLDALEFELSGQRTRIPIGRNLAGEVVFTPPTPAPPVASTTAPPGSATRPAAVAGQAPAPPGGTPGAPAAGAVDPNDPTLSIEERMRLKRAQQGGK